MTLLFMPDISGFSHFVKEVDLRHSKHIITELLEVLIASNSKLQLAEIEGDALFYYTDSSKLAPHELIEKVERMFYAFHEHLNLYRFRRVCNCGACTTAGDLQLKFIVHEGETELMEIQNQKKPFGPAVIALHRLLKNKVPLSEYLLFSQDYWSRHEEVLSKSIEKEIQFLEQDLDGEKYSYAYVALEKPKIDLERPSFPQLKGERPLVLEQKIREKPEKIFQYLVDLNQRTEWTLGLEKLIYPESKPNELEEVHVCVINGKNVEVKTIFSNDTPDEYLYVEESADVPLMDSFVSIFRLFPKENHTLLRFEAYLMTKQWLGKLAKPLIKNKLKTSMVKNLEQLASILEKQV